jgi:hypothetical protein
MGIFASKIKALQQCLPSLCRKAHTLATERVDGANELLRRLEGVLDCKFEKPLRIDADAALNALAGLVEDMEQFAKKDTDPFWNSKQFAWYRRVKAALQVIEFGDDNAQAKQVLDAIVEGQKAEEATPAVRSSVLSKLEADVW